MERYGPRAPEYMERLRRLPWEEMMHLTQPRPVFKPVPGEVDQYEVKPMDAPNVEPRPGEQAKGWGLHGGAGKRFPGMPENAEVLHVPSGTPQAEFQGRRRTPRPATGNGGLSDTDKYNLAVERQRQERGNPNLDPRVRRYHDLSARHDQLVAQHAKEGGPGAEQLKKTGEYLGKMRQELVNDGLLSNDAEDYVEGTGDAVVEPGDGSPMGNAMAEYERKHAAKLQYIESFAKPRPVAQPTAKDLAAQRLQMRGWQMSQPRLVEAADYVTHDVYSRGRRDNLIGQIQVDPSGGRARVVMRYAGGGDMGVVIPFETTEQAMEYLQGFDPQVALPSREELGAEQMLQKRKMGLKNVDDTWSMPEPEQRGATGEWDEGVDMPIQDPGDDQDDSGGDDHPPRPVGAGVPPRLKVAARMPDGTIRTGRPGDIHAMLFSAKEYGDMTAGAPMNRAQMGYVTPEGRFLSRQEAAEWVATADPEAAEKLVDRQSLESVDYEDSRDIARGIKQEPPKGQWGVREWYAAEPKARGADEPAFPRTSGSDTPREIQNRIRQIIYDRNLNRKATGDPNWTNPRYEAELQELRGKLKLLGAKRPVDDK